MESKVSNQPKAQKSIIKVLKIETKSKRNSWLTLNILNVQITSLYDMKLVKDN